MEMYLSQVNYPPFPFRPSKWIPGIVTRFISAVKRLKTMTFRASELCRASRDECRARLSLSPWNLVRRNASFFLLFFLNKRNRGKLMLRREIIICAVHSAEGESRLSYFAIVRRLESAERFVGTLPRQRFPPHQFFADPVRG